MDINTLAILGGEKALKETPKAYNSIGPEEVEAAKFVIEGGVLSKFLGCWDQDFYGGPQVRAFEEAWASYVGSRHAVTVNSLTSGLIAAVGAIGIEPGDEIITTSWTMCATATAILHWNAIPVFADICPRTFNIDPASIEKNITPFTKAILAPDIFGQSVDVSGILKVAQKFNLKVISDSAQSPGALRDNQFAGTFFDIGGYSLNYHKHIHTGEGGVMVTNDDELAERLRLIRNHAESVVEDKGEKNISNMLGYNFRLGEIESAIGLSQLSKLPVSVKKRQYVAAKLNEGLADLQGLRLPFVAPNSTHVYYIYPFVLDLEKIGVERSTILQALEKEGVEGLMPGYTNLHLLPMYQRKIAYGSKGFPWTSDICKRNVSYEKGICPVAEELHEKSFIGYKMCLHELENEDIEAIILAFQKVWLNIDALRAFEKKQQGKV